MSEYYDKPKSHWFLYLVLFLLTFAGLFGFLTYRYYNRSLGAMQEKSEAVLFRVDSDSTVRDVTEKLEAEGLIADSRTAYVYARLNNLTDLYAGEYFLDKSWDVDKILKYLGDPLAANQDVVMVTIVEGDWAKHVAEKISGVTGVSYDDLIALWSNRSWLESQKERYPFITDEMFKDGVRIFLEGYLAPDTYQFMKDTNAEEVTTKLLDQTLKVYDTYKDKFAANELSTHQIYTLASIVQYEGGGTSMDDMKTIAGIFLNRLHSDMALQSSVTVCYAIDYDRNVNNWQDCEVNVEAESPYNTYKYTGLTPGPIENAGTAALEAVLDPINTDYMFFMADVYGGTGIHYAVTEEEHYANVAKYLGE